MCAQFQLHLHLYVCVLVRLFGLTSSFIKAKVFVIVKQKYKKRTKFFLHLGVLCPLTEETSQLC